MNHADKEQLMAIALHEIADVLTRRHDGGKG